MEEFWLLWRRKKHLRDENVSSIPHISSVLLLIIILGFGVYQLIMMSRETANNKYLNKFQRHVLENSLFQHINVVNESDCRKRKFLLYRCGEKCCCGGWGDRQKGIVSAFLLAILTDRTFVIQMEQPCDLQKILEPNLYKWDTCKKYASSMLSRRFVMFQKAQHNLKIDNLSMGFEEFQNIEETVLVVHIRSYLATDIKQFYSSRHNLSWIFDYTEDKIIHMVLNTLFSYRSLLKNVSLSRPVEDLLKRKVVCAHIRLGNSSRMPGDEFKRLISPYKLNLILNFFKNFSVSHEYAIYIATDSQEVRLQAFQRFPNLVPLKLDVIHVDYPPGNRKSDEACVGMRNALLEQWILSSCDVLVLTRSNFGAMAAYMRGTSENLFLFKTNNNKIISAKLHEIQKVFYFN